MDLSFYLALFIFLLGFSAFFSSAEAALFSLSTIKLRAYENDPNPRKRLIASLVFQPRDLLVTIFMLNTLSNILLQNVASSMVGTSGGWLGKVAIPLILTLIFGEILPKYYGLQYNTAAAYLFAPIINWFQNILKPIRKWIINITAPISRSLFFFFKKEEEISKDELQHVLKTSEAQGVLKPEETELVWGYLDLQDSSVKEIMRPREDMLCYEINEPLTKLTHLFSEKKKSHIPVYEKEIDNILGIISAKQYFLHHDQIEKQRGIQALLARPFYVPENITARVLLRKMQKKGQTFAIVVDEYGTIAGLVSLDDILELAIGKLTDESKQNALYTVAGDNEIIASGKLELSTFNEHFGLDLTSGSNMVTISGWLIEQLGDIPKSGQKYQFGPLLFQILSADPQRIRRIYIRKLPGDFPIPKKPGLIIT